MIEHTKLNLDL